MNANYVIKLVMRQVVNRLIRSGIDAGFRKVGGGGKRRRNNGVPPQGHTDHDQNAPRRRGQRRGPGRGL